MVQEPRVGRMEYDLDKVEEITLAVLWLTSFKNADCVRAWKGQDWGTTDRLHSKGYFSDPKSKAKSVVLSKEGEKRSRDVREALLAETLDLAQTEVLTSARP
jgi:hypothetical protein